MNHEEKERRLTIARRILIFWTLFIGVGAVFGGTMMLIKPDGSLLQMGALLPYFQVLPFADVLFQDFLFPGVMLILINGVLNFIAFVFLCFPSRRAGYVLGAFFGVTLMAWITIQFVIFPPNVLSILYFIFGFLQFLDGVIAIIFFEQCSFKDGVAPASNEKSDTLVLYFSRMGYTRKIALALAKDNNAAYEEIKTDELTEKTKGFWWCGRFGMHRWEMAIRPLSHDIAQYSSIIIVSPIWVFHVSSPIRALIRQERGRLIDKKVTVALNHFNSWLPSLSVKEIHSILANASIRSFTTHWGHSKESISKSKLIRKKANPFKGK